MRDLSGPITGNQADGGNGGPPLLLRVTPPIVLLLLKFSSVESNTTPQSTVTPPTTLPLLIGDAATATVTRNRVGSQASETMQTALDAVESPPLIVIGVSESVTSDTDGLLLLLLVCVAEGVPVLLPVPEYVAVGVSRELADDVLLAVGVVDAVAPVL